MKYGPIRLICIGVIVVGLVVIAVGAYSKLSSDSREVLALQDEVKAQLKDPDSAQFRNVVANVGPKKSLSCGEVNAKNAMGGYVGYRPFVKKNDAGLGYVLIFDEPEHALFDADFKACFEVKRTEST